MQESDLIQIVQKAIDTSPTIKGLAIGINGLESRIGGLENRFKGFEGRFEGLEGRIGGLENRFEDFEGRFECLESGVTDLKVALRENTNALEKLQTKVNQLADVVMDTRAVVRALLPLEAAHQQLANRQDAVEDLISRHIKNKKVHRGVEEC